MLSALLPSPGSNIRSQTRSEVELLDISGYRKKPRMFKDLMRVLDSETRLLTPVDPEVTGTNPVFHKPTGRYFQLTHDYLVPSLRQWLNRKKRATRSGRLELRLAERTTMWNAMPERRQLPSTWEWMAIRSATRPAAWTDSQRRMMNAAARHHARSLVFVLALLLVFLFSGLEVTSLAQFAGEGSRPRCHGMDGDGLGGNRLADAEDGSRSVDTHARRARDRPPRHVTRGPGCPASGAR